MLERCRKPAAREIPIGISIKAPVTERHTRSRLEAGERRVVELTDPRPEHDRLIRKLESIAELSAQDERAVRSLSLTLKTLPADTADSYGYELPVTQEELGDALGIPTVHVNRVFQDLREDGLIVFRDGCVSTPDWERLKAAGEFDPTYLHLDREEDAA
jgi:hypothetical protein